MDGTLIDTRELIYQCFRYTLPKYGGTILPREQIFSHIGIPLHKQMEEYLGPLSKERFDTIAADHMQYQDKIHSTYLRIFPGVRDTLAEIKEADKKVGIVTSRRMASLTHYARELDIARFIDVYVTPEHTEKHKPDPQPVLHALSLLQAQAQDTLFVGDAVFDIQSGNRAGVDTALVTWDSEPPDEFDAEPTYVISTISQLSFD
jgi:pyrophosphatase PpaX